MNPYTPRRRSWPRLAIYLLPAVALALLPLVPHVAIAANPPPQQYYYVSLPEDDLLQLFDDDDAAGGTFPDPVSPIRSITSISIGSSGTLVYYDQWEDGSYDADIANPGTNVYNASSNPDGTQIWGDGVLANGCPPSIANVPNPCTASSDDALQVGDVIVLDNDVIVGGTSPGPYSRNASLIFYDGRDKFGTTFPVAVTRAAFPISPGSVMAGANEVLDTGRWGTSYRAPVGENLPAGSTSAFEDVRWFIMVGAGGATISVDANGDGDYGDANDLNGVALAEGAKRSVNGILVNATLAVTAGKAVQVNSMTADVDDTFEFRWDALLPRTVWSNDYYSPVGTALKASNSGCTEVWIHNPNATSITVNITRPGGVNATRTVAANSSVEWPAAATDLYDEGFRMYTTGNPAPVFLPIQIVDCTKDTSGTDGRLYDWGSPLFPASQLTTQLLVPFAQGCSGESFLGICRDADSTSPYDTRDVTTDGYRSPVWVTPLANTTLWIDYDGSGISCPSGAGAETSIAATALVGYRINNDPATRAYVRHGFGSGNYTGTDNIGQGWTQTSSAWANNWTETGDEGTSGAGAIQVVSNELRFGNTGTSNETGWTVRRGVNLTGRTYANLRFHLRDSGLAATDKLAVEATKDGTSWTRLATFQGDQVAATYNPIAATYAVNISPFISANTAIRFVILNNMTGTVYWFVDDVHIDYATGGDWDMTGARIGTCNGVKIAAAWGQDPARSGGNDEEALDMGTGIAPFGSDIAIDKYADKTVVPEGSLVNYTFAVTNVGSTNLTNVSVTDDKCPSAVYSSGDNNPADGMLNPSPAETWYFTCSSNIYFKTTNVAYATGTPESETTPINSAPDEWTVDVIPSAAIGNYVWLDEDGDADQDAGEAGIPNVMVTLTGTDADGNAVSRTVYTDANGGYLFDGLPPSNAAGYVVTVTPPAGLNQTYDENGLGTPNATTVILAAGVEHLTADFGYNWAPSGDTNTPPVNATGAIGDRVWIDADGDGVQDPGEAGLGGVTVNLYTDPDGDGVYNTPAGTATTDAAGNYIFDGLAPDAYVVQVAPPGGYSQTGDPDQLGEPCTACDHKTTVPIVLGPGDVFVNADFGYQPTGTTSDIGDTIYFDANGNGAYNPGSGEYGIPGVTVALLKDDGDGVYEPGIDPIIATDITDASGLYLFPGLPAGTYFVLVNDTEHVLAELAPTGDPDGGKDNRSKVTIDGVNDNLLQDFGYAPAGHDAGEGLLGDTIWLDRDGNGQYNTGEGLEKVKVTLTDPGPDGVLGTDDDTTRSTYTDENGHYSFGSLEPSLSYRVTVDTSTLPAGVTNTVDPDGTTDSTAVRNLAVTGPIDLAADFAYRDLTQPNTIGGTLWEDRDADGILDAGETARFANVTVVLKDANGNIVATTTTNGSGDYSFTGLPDGTFTVDVTDDANLLNGYWHSLGDQNVNSDGTSKVDPFTVSVAGGQTVTTVDFGYYIDPAALGNFVWNDANQNGVQDPGELGIAGVTVKLLITYPNGNVTDLYTITDANGYYSFGNLLLDEDYNQSNPPGGPTQPALVVSVDLTQPVLSGFTPSPTNQTTEDKDSDNPNGEPVINLVQGLFQEEYDFGFFSETGAIGNKVWLDENGDGVQDPGEPGIANVTVQLWDATHTTVVATTYTDANGGYIFKGLPAGTYQVDVLNGSLPAGLVQSTPTYAGDFTNKPDPYTVTVLPGGENLTADFGYNWAPSSDVDGNTGTGAIGDRVWIDADGDGVQDPEEPGLQGVTVELWYDSDNNGTIDAIWPTNGTATTDATGNYIFDQLPAGIYEVRVTAGTGSYAQTGDPDQLGVPCTVCDAKTTTPVLLGPGDVFVNADFGYKPNTGVGADIGDTVWLDANADGLQAGEPGIPGVTVSLIKDVGQIGVYEPGIDLIIATDITDASGKYLFPGVPVGGNYLVWVNDTDNVLDGLAPTFDSNGIGTPNISAVPALPAAGNLLQDFGYAPAGQTTGEGLIGDTIFLDRDGNLTPDPGEGLEGVTVRLYDSTGTTLIATTTTDENGNYYFGNLPAGTYTVKVDTTTLPGGLTNTVDPDGGNNSQSVVTIGGAQPLINLAQDFGYDGTGTIGNLVWKDVNADGVVDADGLDDIPGNADDETGIGGVTVDLYWDSNGNGVLDAGDTLVGSTVTGATGAYSFNNLGVDDGGGDIKYFVHVTDTANVLNGYWHSLGAAGVDNNSQADPYLVTLTTANQTDNTADFGYYRDPAGLGNRVWNDLDEDGIQDAGELGIAGVEVTLTVNWPGDGATVVKTTTDANGFYSFGNLLLDEDFNGVGPGEPTYSITVTPPPAYPYASPAGVGNDRAVDSGLASAETVTTTQGAVNDTYDYGFSTTPTSVTLRTLEATPQSAWEALLTLLRQFAR